MTTTTENWVRITAPANIPFREGRSVRIGGREIAIFNLGERFVAMENRCPHRGGPLADGIVSATGGQLTVTCPLHNHRVSVDTGRVVRPSGQEASCAEIFEVKVEDGIVSVCMAAGAVAQEGGSTEWAAA